MEVISKIVDNVQGQGENRFKNGAYTLVFEYFESVFNPPRILADHWALARLWRVRRIFEMTSG